MYAAQPGQVTEEFPVEAHHITQMGRIVREPGDAVIRRGGVCRGSVIPVGPIDVPVVVHTGTIDATGPGAP
ncbi:hypothetical protein Ari01nite_03360 [Paractinoplanes rishiriensis]|uniref:Uncharacterized protein n=1 Tax=Paractinoplanes rishiriensis TaxID=1050105 RepID=A0A919MME3_9ACTN|nr:hypothetical protein Ari01nite_03360 [Actinoplanes rishiriensis]